MNTHKHIKRKKNYPRQSGLIFISALVILCWGSSGLYWLHSAHLKPSLCLYWPLRLELPQVASLGYHQAPNFLAQPCCVSLSIVKNEALRLSSKESLAFPTERKEKKKIIKKINRIITAFIKRSISVGWKKARITVNFWRQNNDLSCCSVNLMSQIDMVCLQRKQNCFETLRNYSDFITIRLSSLSV